MQVPWAVCFVQDHCFASTLYCWTWSVAHFFLYHMVIGVICIVLQISLQRRVLRTLLCCADLQGRLVI
ncbi:unnamed protein product [Mycena citricolor]|uniref:Uncharacterized protein n=1 Tax=Mycena citricolor TaxID=2018698 RepID=A0AAD2K0S1_9AGAR|nr:unnamed protein product [Mycena citricolor]